MRHAILGVGGVGGLMAGSLARNGESVTLVLRRESIERYPTELKLESRFGDFSFPAERVAVVPPVDVLWIAVKATSLDESLAAIDGASLPRAIVPLLNGVDHVAQLRALCGAERVIPATIAVESERVVPGHIVHRSPFARLNLSAKGKGLLGEAVDGLAQLGFTCQFVDDEATLLWGKLVFLAPVALATTASGKTTSEVAHDPEWQKRLFGSVREAIAVARAEGAKVDADPVIAFINSLPPGMRSSMQKDVEQGKTPELDAIGGPILRGAEKHGLDAPVTRKLVEAVKEKSPGA